MNDQDFQNNWVDHKTWVIGSPTTGDPSMQNGDVVRFTLSGGVKGVQIVQKEDSTTGDPNEKVDDWATYCWLDGDDLVGVKVFRVSLDIAPDKPEKLTCRFVDNPLVPLTIPDPANPTGPPRLVGFLNASFAASAPPARSISVGQEPPPAGLPGNPPSGARRNPGPPSFPQPGGNGGENHRDTATAVFVATEGGPNGTETGSGKISPTSATAT
jgi:hypothetical protein